MFLAVKRVKESVVASRDVPPVDVIQMMLVNHLMSCPSLRDGQHMDMHAGSSEVNQAGVLQRHPPAVE